MLFVYPALSWRSRLINCCGGSPRKTQVPHIPPLNPRVLRKDLYLIRLLWEKCVRFCRGTAKGPFSEPALILAAVNGQKPEFLIFHKRAVPSRLSGLGGAVQCTSKWYPDLAYQMRFGLTSSGHQTVGSPPTSHQAQLSQIYSAEKCWKKQSRPCHASQCCHRDQERGAAGAAEGMFQKPPIIRCVGEANEAGWAPNGIP